MSWLDVPTTQQMSDRASSAIEVGTINAARSSEACWPSARSQGVQRRPLSLPASMWASHRPPPCRVDLPARKSALARRHGRQTTADAVAEAAHITALWARHGFHAERRKPLIHAFLGRNPLTGRLPSGDPITPVVTYPETIDLARVLATLR